MSIFDRDWPPDPDLPVREHLQHLYAALDEIIQSLPMGATEVIAHNQRAVESTKATLGRHDQELAQLRRSLETLQADMEAIKTRLAGWAGPSCQT